MRSRAKFMRTLYSAYIAGSNFPGLSICKSPARVSSSGWSCPIWTRRVGCSWARCQSVVSRNSPKFALVTSVRSTVMMSLSEFIGPPSSWLSTGFCSSLTDILTFCKQREKASCVGSGKNRTLARLLVGLLRCLRRPKLNPPSSPFRSRLRKPCSSHCRCCRCRRNRPRIRSGTSRHHECHNRRTRHS